LTAEKALQPRVVARIPVEFIEDQTGIMDDEGLSMNVP